jgi:hypothetical protein
VLVLYSNLPECNTRTSPFGCSGDAVESTVPNTALIFPRLEDDPVAARDQRKAELEDLKQRCFTESGIRISGQDLRRVARYKQPNTLYKWLNKGALNKRFREAIGLPTTEFVTKALRLRPDQKIDTKRMKALGPVGSA